MRTGYARSAYTRTHRLRSGSPPCQPADRRPGGHSRRADRRRPGQSIWRDYWIASAYRGNRPASVVYEAATVESELHALATGRGISITADSTARFYARPGVIFKQIVDMPHSIIAIGYREGANRRVRDFIPVVEALLRGKG